MDALNERYIISLLSKDDNDKKENYIKDKIKRRGVEHLSIKEVNYLRKKNNLAELKISKLRTILYENIISYSDLQKATGISRTMMSMILNGSRNCTIAQITKIYKYLKELKIKDIDIF